ncbi:MAG: hypothetical protein HC798_00995 [Polaribacter sp.]|nr:hypothetical protein [Polaribacter sp.]
MLTVTCSAQLIIPVEEFEKYNKEIPDYSYIMDTNNLLANYTGTWLGTYNGFKFTLLINKITEDNTHLKYKHDKLIIKYKVVDASNNELINTFNFDSSSPNIMRGKYFKK